GIPDHPDWLFTRAVHINDSRQVSGTGLHSVNGTAVARGFWLDLNSGLVTDLGPPSPSDTSSTLGLNNRQAGGVPAPQVGVRENINGSPQYFLFGSGSYLPLNGLQPNGVNDRGEVGGSD